MSRTADAFADESLATVARFEGVCLGDSDGVQPNPVSFALAPGGLHLLTGPARSGKTAIMNIVGLSARPLTGRIELFGRDLARIKPRGLPPLRRRIGRVFQDLRLDEDLNVFDNVALAVRATGAAADDSRHRIAEVLRWMGLAEQMAKRPKRLSILDQRRLAIARAVINRPTLVIADEPTGDLDEQAAAGLMRRLVDIHRVGTTVLVASRRPNLLGGAEAAVISLAPSAPDAAAA